MLNTPWSSRPLTLTERGELYCQARAGDGQCSPLLVPVVGRGLSSPGSSSRCFPLNPEANGICSHCCAGTASAMITRLQRPKTLSDSTPFWLFSPKLPVPNLQRRDPSQRTTAVAHTPLSDRTIFGHCILNSLITLRKCSQFGLYFPSDCSMPLLLILLK